MPRADYSPMVRQISDTVSVMHNGRQVPNARCRLGETVFQKPESDEICAPIDAIHAGPREVERMTTATLPKRLGFFTRLLDQVDPAERYRLATAQIIHAERCGFDSAWVAQHVDRLRRSGSTIWRSPTSSMRRHSSTGPIG